MSFFLLIFHTYTHPHTHINCLTIEKKPTISNMYVSVYMCEKLTKKLKWFSCREHNNNNSETAYLFMTAIPRIRRHATSDGSECLVYRCEFAHEPRQNAVPLPSSSPSPRSQRKTRRLIMRYSTREDVPIEKIVSLCH